VDKLSNLNFESFLNSAKEEIVKQFEKDLKKQLIVIDEQSKNLQDKINEFNNQISRLEAIDFETHFTNLITDLTNQNNEVKLQNEELLKEIKTNRIMSIVGIVIIVGLLIFKIILK